MVSLREYYPIEKGRAYIYRIIFPKKVRLIRKLTNVVENGRTVTARWEEEMPRKHHPPSRRKWAVKRSSYGVHEEREWVLRTPLRKGREWTGKSGKFIIETVNGRVTVPAGSFSDCVRVYMKSTDYAEGFSVYAKGVGLVKDSRWVSREGAEFWDSYEMELVSVSG